MGLASLSSLRSVEEIKEIKQIDADRNTKRYAAIHGNTWKYRYDPGPWNLEFGTIRINPFNPINHSGSSLCIVYQWRL